MRIAWITYDFEEYSALHVNELARDHDVLLAMPQADEEAEPPKISRDVEHFEFLKPRLRQPLRQLQSVRRIVQRIKAFRPDVVHFQQGHLWFNTMLSRLRRYPLVITIHDPRHHAGDLVSKKTPQWLMDYGFRQAKHVIVHGEALAQQVHALFALNHDQIDVIPHVAMGGDNTLDDESEDPNLVLFFGRIWDYKGLEHLIDAQPMISAECPNAKIMIAGEGEDFAKYRQRMQDPSRFVIRNAWISDHQRARYFQRCAVVVLPYNEATQSGVVPVAYNFARPVVATRVGALAECVDHEKTGLLVPAGDANSLAGAIARLLKDGALRRKMGLAGRERLRRESSPQVVAQKTADVYRRVIEAFGEGKQHHAVAESSMVASANDPVAGGR